jgi:hypothetical protein
MGTLEFIISPAIQELYEEVNEARAVCLAERKRSQCKLKNVNTHVWEWSYKYYKSREFIWDIIRRDHNSKLTDHCWHCLFEINPSLRSIDWKEMISKMPEQLPFDMAKQQ